MRTFFEQALAWIKVRPRELGAQAWALARLHPWRTAALTPVFFVALLLLYTLVLIPFTPSIGDLRKAKSESPAMVLSADGKELAVFKRANRDWVKLKDISPTVVAALIATEDHRFYSHHGIDVTRTMGAVMHTLGGDMQGGSTLTQQLARNLYPEDIGRAPTITRKIKEAITALKIEAVYTKDEILETYLNTVPFLFNAFGIEMAARTYFDKTADTLDVLESATLVGMLKGTSYYNPVQNPQRATQRRNTVLGQMVKHNKLAQANFDKLKKQPLKIDFERQSEDLGAAPHVTQQLRRWLIDWADRNGRNMYADGLVIHTTIDSRLQTAANNAVERHMNRLQSYADAGVRRGKEKPQLAAGFLAVDPSSGHVKAWVGSRDFATDQFDHVQQARRQPGSTFKPFVYGAAFEQGISPLETFIDGPVEITVGRNDVWRPTDAGEPSNEPMTLRDGLAYSKNTITAQLIQRIGPARVAALARSMGVRYSKLDEVMSLALGTSPVTLREMVASYGTIANGGSYIEPMLVTHITDSSGRVLERFAGKAPETAMSNAAAVTLVDVMRGVIDRGTGTRIRNQFGIQADVAGKTGTTQDNTDAWFMLMHPQLVAGAWVGYNDSRITMASSWGQGSQGALPIVGEFFQQALRGKVIDAKVRFATPAPAEPPSGGALDRMYDWINSALGGKQQQEAGAQPPVSQPQAVQAQTNPSAELQVNSAPPPVPAQVPVQSPMQVQAPVRAPQIEYVPMQAATGSPGVPVEVRPVEIRPVEIRPVEIRPVETPVEIRPIEGTPITPR